MNSLEEPLARLAAKVAEQMNTSQRIAGGRNAQVYRLICESGRSLVAKVYYQDPSDGRDRLAAEYGGLSFLWRNGIRCIPEPLAEDSENSLALYEAIDGEPIDSRRIRAEDIDTAIDFLISLDRVKMKEGASGLPSASEACFSSDALIRNVRARFERLGDIREGVLLAELKSFLYRELQPFFERVCAWSTATMMQEGTPAHKELSPAERTLSPSDFGFHNAIRRADGQITFLDFEYFGWDDPAKMMVDFVLHPAMDLPLEAKRRFWDGLLAHFGDSGDLLSRLKAVYPLYGIKWCLILLNEFVPHDMARRSFARTGPVDDGELRERQLDKAKNTLIRIEQSYEHGFSLY